MNAINTRQESRYYMRDLIVDGKKVSWLTVIDYQMRIGSAEVRMAGIAGVGTERDERMKGYSRRVLEDTVRYMTEEGYDVSALFGIPNFYHKFGYATCLPEPGQTVTTRNAEAAKADAGSYTVREAGTEDSANILKLYNEANRSRMCTLVRFKEHFSGLNMGSSWGHKAKTIVFEDPAGVFAGYAAHESDERINIIEVEATSPQVFPAMLYEFVKLAIDHRCGEISFMLPQEHPFAHYLHRFECSLHVQYPKCRAGMMRIINQQSLFTKIQNELSARLQNSSLHNFSGQIGIKTELACTLLDIDAGQVSASAGESNTCIELPQSKLMQLITGYRPISDLLTENDVKITGNALPILSALFPKTEPHIWADDHF